MNNTVSALTKKQEIEARILDLQNKSNEISSKIHRISENIREINDSLIKKEEEDRESKYRRSIFLFVLLAIFVFIFLRYYFIISY